MIGVTKQKNYYTDKKVTDIIQDGDGINKQRYVFDETFKKPTLKDEKEKLKKDLTVEKFKLMRKIIDNEKKVSQIATLVIRNLVQLILSSIQFKE